MEIRTHQCKRSGFTLAELLTVIAIIGVLFAIALPAFNSLTGEAKLDAAANAVHAAARLARQHAVTHGQPTYLVLHDAQSTTDDGLAYRAYAVFSINIHTNITPVPPSAGYFLTEWQTLPEGVVFDPVSNLDSNLFDISTQQNWSGALNRNNELRIGGTNTFVVFGFKPNGEAASTTHNIHMAPGVVENGSVTLLPGQGRQICFEMIGTSKIRNTAYNESGAFRLLNATGSN
jgi:prepilin-type N-terminal cleavage/methylation domain-containing protein